MTQNKNFGIYLIVALIALIIFFPSGKITTGADVILGEREGRMIVSYLSEPDLGRKAIIPLYVNANTLLNFQGELSLKQLGVFRCSTSNEIWVNIYNFDSSKTQFKGTKYNTFYLPFPSSAKADLGEDSIVTWDAQMTTPSVKGKYRYEGYLIGCADTFIDYDTFTVLNDVPETCDLPTTQTTYQDISNGKLKIVTLTEYTGSACTQSIIKTYNTICNNGYEEKGSGASGYCSKIEVPPGEEEPEAEPEGCTTSEVCCEFRTVEEKIAGKSFPQHYECRTTSTCLPQWGFQEPITDQDIIDIKCGGGTPADPTDPTPCVDANDNGICDEDETPKDCNNPLLSKELKSNLFVPTEKEVQNALCKVSSECCEMEGYTTGCVRSEKFEEEFGLDVTTGIWNGFKQWWGADYGACVAVAEDGDELDVCGWTDWAPKLGGMSKCTSAYIIAALLLFVALPIISNILSNIGRGKK